MATIHPDAWVSPTAVVRGDVTIGPGSRILDLAVLHGELGPITIGADVVVMEHALIRGRGDHPVVIGDAVLVGPHAHLNGTVVEDEVFVSPDRHDELWAAQEPLDFPGTVYGVPRGASMREIMRKQSATFGPR